MAIQDFLAQAQESRRKFRLSGQAAPISSVENISSSFFSESKPRALKSQGVRKGKKKKALAVQFQIGEAKKARDFELEQQRLFERSEEDKFRIFREAETGKIEEAKAFQESEAAKTQAFQKEQTKLFTEAEARLEAEKLGIIKEFEEVFKSSQKAIRDKQAELIAEFMKVKVQSRTSPAGVAKYKASLPPQPKPAVPARFSPKAKPKNVPKWIRGPRR